MKFVIIPYARINDEGGSRTIRVTQASSYGGQLPQMTDARYHKNQVVNNTILMSNNEGRNSETFIDEITRRSS
jgi:hypothetical protein